MMMCDAAIDTAIIFTRNMEKLAAFYREGFELGTPNTSPGHMGFGVGQVYLGFDQVDDGFETPGPVTLWFRVNNVQATFDHFVEMGARVRYAPSEKGWGDTLAAIYDPEGNMIGLSQRRLTIEE